MKLLYRSAVVLAIAAACFAQALSRAEAYRRAHDLSALGKRMFFDPSLSASGTMSCATCHDPKFAYGPSNGLAAARGGRDGRQWGHRAVPSLRYLQSVPAFTEHYFDAETTGSDSADNGPTGGLTWDGRVDRGRDQARLPLLSAYEMANADPDEVVKRAMRANYAGEIQRLQRGSVFDTILEAFEAWEQEPAEFYPYSSKYDAYLAGKASLTAQELRGLRLFTDPAKGNCARCHPSAQGASGTSPQFTDFGLIAIGVPRNPEIPANANASWFDLGLCGPDRTDFRGRPDYCGRFRAPTLRNVALRRSFFHNGAYHTLREAVRFYVKRDPGAADLPGRYRSNLETGAPFPVSPNDKSSLDDGEIDDIVQFLKTLTDR
ncbi:MAG TPA: cytochrome c peroxidase [Bryobacteraceae bacterium]|nr:cytochrome c peroxidase [Bryobacteraceae bacterium]